MVTTDSIRWRSAPDAPLTMPPTRRPEVPVRWASAPTTATAPFLNPPPILAQNQNTSWINTESPTPQPVFYPAPSGPEFDLPLIPLTEEALNAINRPGKDYSLPLIPLPEDGTVNANRVAFLSPPTAGPAFLNPPVQQRPAPPPVFRPPQPPPVSFQQPSFEFNGSEDTSPASDADFVQRINSKINANNDPRITALIELASSDPDTRALLENVPEGVSARIGSTAVANGQGFEAGAFYNPNNKEIVLSEQITRPDHLLKLFLHENGHAVAISKLGISNSLAQEAYVEGFAAQNTMEILGPNEKSPLQWVREMVMAYDNENQIRASRGQAPYLPTGDINQLRTAFSNQGINLPSEGIAASPQPDSVPALAFNQLGAVA